MELMIIPLLITLLLVAHMCSVSTCGGPGYPRRAALLLLGHAVIPSTVTSSSVVGATTKDACVSECSWDWNRYYFLWILRRLFRVGVDGRPRMPPGGVGWWFQALGFGELDRARGAHHCDCEGRNRPRLCTVKRGMGLLAFSACETRPPSLPDSRELCVTA